MYYKRDILAEYTLLNLLHIIAKLLYTMSTTKEAYRISITHVILDFDGLLVDTERLYSGANEAVLGKFGVQFTLEIKSKMMGQKKEDAVRVLLKEAGLSDTVTVEKYMEIYDREIEEMMKRTKPLPGATKLIDHLHSNGIPLGICTGSDAVEFRQKTANPEVADWLEKIPLRVLCGSDPEVKNGKPAPDPYLVAMSRFPHPKPVSPKNVLVFEDSINGANSALAAGCTVIMVPQRDQLPTDWNEAGMRERTAGILKSLEDFTPHHYQLPAYPEALMN